MTTVAVVGASPKPERYSNRACRLLLEHDHTTYAVSPRGSDIEQATGVRNLREISEPIDTVTMYVGPAKQEPIIEDIIASNPRRVIFNPGTESEAHEQKLKNHGIDVVHACTLVMLNTGQF